jgi:3-deoxy-7-phosphoheptulonate synthase
MPVGFKNRTDGNVQVAVDAVRAAAVPHVFAGIDLDGRSALLHTRGNRDCHVILRGGRGAPNHGAESVRRALELLRHAGLRERLMIDLSHDNSGKDAGRQPEVAGDVAAQLGSGNRSIVGGRQDLQPGTPLRYGQSITDGCLSWGDTEVVLGRLAEAVRARRGPGA